MKRPADLTPRQFKALQFIITYQAANSQSPTFSEVGAALSVGFEAAHGFVRRLKAKGYIEHVPRSQRALKVTDKALRGAS